MFYKAIIFDLDNTLYDYKNCHTIAINLVLNRLIEVYNSDLPVIEVIIMYHKISDNLKYELNQTASSHNKGIYLKQLLESFDLGFHHYEELYELYWHCFFEKMVCFSGVYDFLMWNKQLGKKIGILTDYETEFQLKKIKQLKIAEFIDVIVTSEEVGIEKPSRQMFQTILNKLNVVAEETIMIGDDFDKDVKGALNAGIFTYWCTKEYLKLVPYYLFSDYLALHNDFKKIHENLCELKNVSKFVGERFDLVQAGGGNSSVKCGDWMFIKSSGVNMTNIDTENGYAVIDNKTLLSDILRGKTKEVTKYNVFGKKRASIETFMHSVLKKYTLHIHPIQVNRVLVRKNADEIVKTMFPDALVLDYSTPGIDVCNELLVKWSNQNLIFLLNHGIIITSDTYEEIYVILRDVIERFETKFQCKTDMWKYTNTLSSHINGNFHVENVSWLCENQTILKYLQNNPNLFYEKITFPDALIYCGITAVNNFAEIRPYYEKYGELPKIYILQNNIYINAPSLSKCREIEEVLLANLLVLDTDDEKNYLSEDEICFLNNWDAEKYRKSYGH